MKRRSPARIKRRSSRRHVSQTPRMKRTNVRSPTYDDTPLAGKKFYRHEFTRQQELVNAIRRSMYRQEHLPDSARIYDGAKGEFEPQQPLLLPTRDGRRQDVHTLDTNAVCSGHTDCLSFQGNIADFMNLKPVSYREREKIILQLNSGDASFFPERGVLCFKVDGPRNVNHAFCVYFEVDTVYIIQSYVREQIPLVTKMPLQLFCDHLWNLLFGDNWNKSYSKLFRVRLSPKGVYKAGAVKLAEVFKRPGSRRTRQLGGTKDLYIPENVLNNLRAFVDFSKEFCGNFKVSRTIPRALEIDKSQAGIPGHGQGNRMICTPPFYLRYTWHSHPNSVGSFPSAEDILNVIQQQIIDNSILISQWGVWEIHVSTLLPKKRIPANHIDKIKYFLNDAGTPEHKKPIKLMVDATGDGKARAVRGHQITLINNYVKDVEFQLAYFGLKMAFTPWAQLNAGYSLKF